MLKKIVLSLLTLLPLSGISYAAEAKLLTLKENESSVSNFLEFVPPDFQQCVPLDFHEPVPRNFHHVVPRHASV